MPYFPSYQPYYNTFNAIPTQPIVGPTQPTQQIIWVSGPQEAQMYPIAPNNAVTLWDKSGKNVYVKTADATGKPSMTVYDLVERKINATESVSEADSNLPTYATKEQLEAVSEAVKGLDALVGNIRADIESMKGDLYGIAGAKKKAKKDDE